MTTVRANRALPRIQPPAHGLGKLLHTLYDDLSETSSWSRFLGELGKVIPATYIAFGVRPADQRNDKLTFPYTSVGPEIHRARTIDATAYTPLDPFVSLPEGLPITLKEFIPAAQLERSTFFKNYLEVVDLVHVLGVDLKIADTYEARFRISRSRKQGDFDADERALCAELVPHLRTAARMRIQFEALRLKPLAYDDLAEASVETVQRLLGLTRTEATFALALARGKTIKEVARHLGVSICTARTHMRSIFLKTGVDKQTKLVREVLQRLSPLGFR